MSVDRIASIEAFSIRLPRDAAAVTGTAGTPAKLAASGFDYRWSETNSTLYSVNFEAALVKVTLESGLAGWGEAQAPLAPDIACLIIDQLLRPAVEGQDFDGSPDTVRSFRNRMYSTMRVRGQTGGFMLDAIAGVDIALWDLAGKARGTSVADLLSSSAPKSRIPCYLSGAPGRNERGSSRAGPGGLGRRISNLQAVLRPYGRGTLRSHRPPARSLGAGGFPRGGRSLAA